MSVRLAGDVAKLVAPSVIEDAEALLSFLEAGARREVDWTQAGPLHGAVLQILLILRPRVTGTPPALFEARWIEPLLTGIDGLTDKAQGGIDLG